MELNYATDKKLQAAVQTLQKFTCGRHWRNAIIGYRPIATYF